MWTKLIAISDLALFVVLAGCGAWVIGTQHQRPDAAAAAALAGALFSGSAILLGNCKRLGMASCRSLAAAE